MLSPREFASLVLVKDSDDQIADRGEIDALGDVGSARAEHRFKRQVDLRFRNIGTDYRSAATDEFPVILCLRWILSFREDARERQLVAMEQVADAAARTPPVNCRGRKS